MCWGSSSVGSDDPRRIFGDVGVPTSDDSVGTSGESKMKDCYVYILRSLRNNRFYIGSTTNVDRRFHQHNVGSVRATRNIRPLNLELSQKFDNISLTRKIEQRLKKFKRRDFIEKIIKDGVIRLGQ